MGKEINSKLDELKEIKSKITELMDFEKTKIEEIKKGFVDTVVVFIDLVDSTLYKSQNITTPQKWIVRQIQFLEILSEYITKTNGKVIKYIGDEIMGYYEGKSAVSDSLNLISRREEIEQSISEISQEPTKIKIAIDKGDVFFVKFEGHSELDPQGLPVDRCARISKFLKPSTILSSFDYVQKCPEGYQWHNVGEADLKGIGKTSIYQFAKNSIVIENKKEITLKEYDSLNQIIYDNKKVNETLILENKKIKEMNKNLENQFLKLKQKPDDENIVKDQNNSEGESLLSEIKSGIDEIDTLINESRVDKNEYSRFLFLHFKGEEGQSSFNRDFNSCLDANLIHLVDKDYYSLDTHNKRNKKILKIMEKLEFELNDYENNYLEEEILYKLSFKDPDFWKEYLGRNVL